MRRPRLDKFAANNMQIGNDFSPVVIWQIVRNLVTAYGADAHAQAATIAEAIAIQGNYEAAIIWRKISRACLGIAKIAADKIIEDANRV